MKMIAIGARFATKSKTDANADHVMTVTKIEFDKKNPMDTWIHFKIQGKKESCRMWWYQTCCVRIS